MKKIAIIFFFSLIILAGLGLGKYFLSQKSAQERSKKITFGYQDWPGVLPYLVAYEKGFFQEQGLDVQIVKADSYVQEIADLLAGRYDFIGDMALIDVVKNVSLGEKLQVVLASDYSNGADGLVVKKTIENISQLKGKEVAVEINTLGEYLLYDALAKNRLSLQDVKIVNLSAQEAAQAFIRGEVEAAVAFEPDLSQAVNKGNGQLIYTSADSPRLIIDVLVFKPDFIKKNPATVGGVLKAYLAGMDYIAKNPDEAYVIGAKYFKITADEVKQQLGGVRLIDKGDNLNLMVYKRNTDSLHGLVDRAYKFLAENQAVEKKVDSLEIINPKFIRSLSEWYVD